MRKIVASLVMTVAVASMAHAVDVAPRISDREIIEKLAKLEAGQESLRAEMNTRFDAQQKEMNTRFDAQQKEMNARFEAQQKQLDQIYVIMVAMFASTTAMISALIGFIVWDRKTVLRPMEARMNEVERAVTLRQEEIPQFQQLLEALKSLAKSDGKLAEALRHAHLL